jgi:hypothetical protein
VGILAHRRECKRVGARILAIEPFIKEEGKVVTKIVVVAILASVLLLTAVLVLFTYFKDLIRIRCEKRQAEQAPN